MNLSIEHALFELEPGILVVQIEHFVSFGSNVISKFTEDSFVGEMSVSGESVVLERSSES